jgi:hypothetical protein
MTFTPSLLRDLRSLRVRFKEFIDHQDNLLAAEELLHNERLAKLPEEVNLLKPFVATLSEVVQRDSILVIGDRRWFLGPEERSRRERLRSINEERAINVMVLKYLDDAAKKVEEELEQ